MKKKGFTLIELLVVIFIIGLLTSIILVSLNGARSKARDAKRISDLNQISVALELYYHNHGSFPNIFPSGWNQAAAGTGCWANWQAGNSDNGSSVQFLQPLVTDGEMATTPLESYLSGCVYRAMNVGVGWFPNCGTAYDNSVALYALLENPRSSIPNGYVGAQPSCFSSYWYEAGATDPNGYLMFVK